MRGARKKGDRTGTRGMHSARDPRGTWHSVQVSNIRGETPNTAIPFPLSISQSCSLLDPPHSLPSLVSFLFWLNIAVSGVVYPPFVSFRSFSTLQTQSSLLPSSPSSSSSSSSFFFVSFQVRTSPSKKLLLLPTNIPSPPPSPSPPRRRRRRERRRGKKERRVEQVFLFFAFSKSRSCEVLTDNRGIRPFSCHKSRDSAQ